MTIFDRVKEAANKKGLSLQVVATKAGFGINSIYGWKKKDPSISRVEKVAKVLNVSTDYLLGNDDGKKVTADLDDDDVIFTYQGKPLSEEDKALIKRLMNGKD
ncbi:helix-turn-helix domain-containing protein [Limosilactobacillus antri]|uniref:helix-turn-helix domain-containing protein n=1 Tax=Limosilactobacillus antri TaxID=227943 RepID=UPI001F5A5909|nr:helix-turn-helix transcriptional regulator [Limosilactobacillus antri]